MIIMQNKQEIIIRFFRNGESKRHIARDLKMCPKTVSKFRN